MSHCLCKLGHELYRRYVMLIFCEVAQGIDGMWADVISEAFGLEEK